MPSSSAEPRRSSYSLTLVRGQRLAGRFVGVEHRFCRRPPPIDLDSTVGDPYAALRYQPHRERVDPMLDPEDPRRQARLVVTRSDRYDRLGDDRSDVDLRADEMHGATAEAHPRSKRLPLRVKTRKCREQRRMDIDHPAAPVLDKGSVEHPHEPGKAYQIH